MNFRINLICSLIALILFHLLTFSYPFLPGHVQTFSSASDPLIRLNLSIPYMQIHLPDQSQNGSNVGCDTAKFNWCDSARPLSPFYFYSCYILFIGLAFPNINVTLNTIFSKVIGPRRQGTQQGFLQMSGGTARMLGPVVIRWAIHHSFCNKNPRIHSLSYLYTWFGPQSAWLMEIGLTAITLAYWFILYRRMVPLKLPPELLAHSKSTQMDSSSSSASSSSTRRKRKKNVEERKPLFDPIEEEGADGEADEVRAQQQRNQATVSTVASLRDEEGGLQPQ
jgi:MFS transporter, ceroid-lipofuscinosis neuronal protein 7